MNKKKFIEKWFAELNWGFLADNLATDFVKEVKALLAQEWKNGYQAGKDDCNFEHDEAKHLGGMKLTISIPSNSAAENSQYNENKTEER